MPNDKETKIEEVVLKLQKQIADGEYSAGQRLPSERDIADSLKVSRVTVRSALLRLQADNLIDIVPRGGAFVRSPNIKAIMGGNAQAIAKGLELMHAGSFVRAMQAQGRDVQVRFIEPSAIIPVGEEIGAKMQTTSDTPVLRRYRVHLVDRTPYRILDSYYLASLLGGLLGKDQGYIPLFKWMRDNTGQYAARALEQLDCRMPTAQEAIFLNIARNQPVVDMERWVWSDKNVLFEYSRIVANAALHSYTYSYEITEEASR